jgi:glyoxylate/hydroxypyruvate reductase A
MAKRQTSVAFVSSEVEPERWLARLEKALPEMRFEAWPALADPASVEVALVAAPPAGVLGRLPNLRFIQSLWMGVDGLLADPTLPRGVPIARLIDPGMVAAMSETVLARVLDWHRHLYRYRVQQAARAWTPLKQFMASDRTVGILGLGMLGADAAAKLAALGFRVCGWSRRQKELPGVESFCGPDGLETMLRMSEALVCLLPLTAGTRGLLDARRLALLPAGACVISVGRGAQVVEHDLLAAARRSSVLGAPADQRDAPHCRAHRAAHRARPGGRQPRALRARRATGGAGEHDGRLLISARARSA